MNRYDDLEYQKQVSLQMLATPTLEIACRAITDLRQRVKDLEHQHSEAIQAVAREAKEWDVRKFVKDIPEGEGLSHEDGWTIMRTETADSLKKDANELRQAKKQLMNIFTGGKLFPTEGDSK